MNWKSQGSSAFSSPYQIHRDILGYSVWLSSKNNYGVLGRQLPTLEAAKAFALEHSKKEVA